MQGNCLGCISAIRCWFSIGVLKIHTIKKNKFEDRMEKSMTTTTFELNGYRVVKHLGVIRGIVVRSRSVFGTIGGMLHTLVGGNITLFTELCEKTRVEAFDMMISHVEELVRMR
jgi:hypothetical protein